MAKKIKGVVVPKGGVASADALVRAREGKSKFNVPKILAFFAAKGIAITEADIRENVLTFKAWTALGRVVKKGEHGCHIVVFGKDEKTGKTRGYGAVVFHKEQTEVLTAKAAPKAKVEKPTVSAPAPEPVVSAPAPAHTMAYNFDAMRKLMR